jgi:hypothetical protein
LIASIEQSSPIFYHSLNPLDDRFQSSVQLHQLYQRVKSLQSGSGEPAFAQHKPNE